MTQTVLILGASGRFGRHASAAFDYAGWEVRHFDRSTQDLWDAAWGADVIVNAWNPAYTDWERDIPLLTEQVIEIAKASGATVMIPGNVYVYGPDTAPPWAPETPHAATNPLGRARIEMERAYRDANIPTVILRGGDFLDTMASGNWFDRIMTPRIAKGQMTYPGALDAAHVWAWLPDMADALVMLAERRDQLQRFEDIAFPGYTLTGHQLAQALSKVTQRPVTAKPMAWWPLQLARPFWAMATPLLEMRYLWDTPHTLDGTRFAQVCPDFRDTPLLDALDLAVEPQMYPDQPVRATCVHRFGERIVGRGPQHA